MFLLAFLNNLMTSLYTYVHDSGERQLGTQPLKMNQYETFCKRLKNTKYKNLYPLKFVVVSVNNNKQISSKKETTLTQLFLLL